MVVNLEPWQNLVLLQKGGIFKIYTISELDC